MGKWKTGDKLKCICDKPTYDMYVKKPSRVKIDEIVTFIRFSDAFEGDVLFECHEYGGLLAVKDFIKAKPINYDAKGYTNSLKSTFDEVKKRIAEQAIPKDIKLLDKINFEESDTKKLVNAIEKLTEVLNKFVDK